MIVEDLFTVIDKDEENLKHIKGLFLEYARSLEFYLCFQNYEKELSSLQSLYDFPSGSLMLLTIGNQPAGCTVLR